MALNDFLKRVGVLEDDGDKQDKKEPPRRNPPPDTTRPTVADVRSIGEPQPAVQFTSDTLEAYLEQSIQANIDFLPAANFLATLDAIKGVISEEGLRFRTAQATTKIDAGVLLTALQSHTAALQYEASQFEQSVVNTAIDAINTKTAQVGELQAQIDHLNQQLAELATQKDQLNADIITSNANLEKSKVDYTATQSRVAQRYSDLTKKVSQYLGAA